MQYFACDICDNVDIVDLAYSDGVLPAKAECTACQGKWHELFPQRKYVPGQDYVINRVNGIGLG